MHGVDWFQSGYFTSEPANKISVFQGGSIAMGLGAVALQFVDFIKE